MWFVFPQIAGLGHSAMAQRYAISSRDEAEPISRIRCSGRGCVELTRIVNGVQDARAEQIFGYPDDMKFHSSMTLFARCAADGREFDEALRSTSAAGRNPRRSTGSDRHDRGIQALRRF